MQAVSGKSNGLEFAKMSHLVFQCRLKLSNVPTFSLNSADDLPECKQSHNLECKNSFGLDNGPGPNSDPDGAPYTGWFSGPVINLRDNGWNPNQTGQTVTWEVIVFDNGSLFSGMCGSSELFQVNEVTSVASPY